MAEPATHHHLIIEGEGVKDVEFGVFEEISNIKPGNFGGYLLKHDGSVLDVLFGGGELSIDEDFFGFGGVGYYRVELLGLLQFGALAGGDGVSDILVNSQGEIAVVLD